MPYISDWDFPGVAYMIDGFPIYHAYKDNECGAEERMALSFWYQVPEDPEDPWDPDAWVEFDIRKLPEYDGDDDDKILKAALESGSLAKAVGFDIEFPLKELEWSVPVDRLVVQSATVAIKARSWEEARKLAVETATGMYFSGREKEAKYEAGTPVCRG